MVRVTLALAVIAILALETADVQARCWVEGPFWRTTTYCTADTPADRRDTPSLRDSISSDVLLEEVLPGTGEYVRYLDSQAGGSIRPVSEANPDNPIINARRLLPPGQPWKRLPGAFKNAVHGVYPDLDLDRVRYVANIDTIHGKSVTIGHNIYMPGPVDMLDDRASFSAILHELQHLHQTTAEGGMLPFALVYLTEANIELGPRGSFNIHSIPELENDAIATLLEVGEGAWLRAYPIRGTEEYCDLSVSQQMKIAESETDDAGMMKNAVVMNKEYARCLDIAPEGTAAHEEGVAASLQACVNVVDLQQRWNWIDNGSHWFRWYHIQNSHTGKCLELDGARVVQKQCDMGSATQMWKKIDRDGSYFRLRNKASTKCMDFFAKK